jgi:ADP-ribose diphosphatase
METTYCADALVFAWTGGYRWVLLGERAREDSPGWAIPGGKVNPGEDPLATAVRELREETGLSLTYAGWTVGDERVVPDPRRGRRITRVCTTDLGSVDELPRPEALDGTRRVDWFRARSFGQTTRDLHTRYGGRIFEAHVGVLIEYINADWTGLADGDRT